MVSGQPATAYALWTTSARAYAFLLQSVKAYFFLTKNDKAYFFQTRVKVYSVRTIPATAYSFRTNIVSEFAFWTLRIKACLPTGATAHTFWTTLVKAHTTPIVREPGRCVLVEDRHRISLPGDECHDNWRSDDAYCTTHMEKYTSNFSFQLGSVCG